MTTKGRITMKWQPGNRVHVNKDDTQWGRLASDGTIIEVRTKSLLVSVDSVRANVTVPKKNAYPI